MKFKEMESYFSNLRAVATFPKMLTDRVFVFLTRYLSLRQQNLLVFHLVYDLI